MNNHELPRRIDVHHHVIAPAVYDHFEKMGIREIGGVVVPRFNKNTTLEMMNQHGIERAIFSLSDVGRAFKQVENAVMIARQSNDFAAQLCHDDLDRFGAFGTLPLPHMSEALSELERIYDELHLTGVMLLSNNEGYYLGDSYFDPLMAELDKRHAVVFLHPSLPLHSENNHLDFPGFLLEFVFDTTRAVVNMLLNKVPERFPHIRFILAHAGGTVPYLAERIALGQLSREPAGKLNASSPIISGLVNSLSHLPIAEHLMENVVERHLKDIKSGLGSLYYDTALTSLPSTLNVPMQYAGLEHILFGSDYPYAPEIVLDFSDKMLQEGFDSAQLQAIYRQNALNLFPQWQ